MVLGLKTIKPALILCLRIDMAIFAGLLSNYDSIIYSTLLNVWDFMVIAQARSISLKYIYEYGIAWDYVGIYS